MTYEESLSGISVDYDACSGILYVKLLYASLCASICVSQPLEGDDFVILNKDSRGAVVGLQLIDVREMSSARWEEHFHTPEIPEPLFAAVDDWLRRNK